MLWLAVGRFQKCQGRGRVGRGWFQLRKVCRSDSRLACRRRLGPPLVVNARSTLCGPIVIAHMLACISVSFFYCTSLLPARQQQTFITTDYVGITMPYLNNIFVTSAILRRYLLLATFLSEINSCHACSLPTCFTVFIPKCFPIVLVFKF